jgi:hypothetical protein
MAPIDGVHGYSGYGQETLLQIACADGDAHKLPWLRLTLESSLRGREVEKASVGQVKYEEVKVHERESGTTANRRRSTRLS